MKPHSLLLVLALLIGALASLTPTQLTSAHAPQAALLSPEGRLHPDGTLALDGTLRGALDLRGYSVALDAGRGPVLSPKAPGSSATLAAASGQWASLGPGGGQLSNLVMALAVDGSNVYVGGYFRDAAGLGAADYIVKWDGASWSALGSGAGGNGSLNGAVNALALSGTTLYVGGNFTNVNTGGTPNSAADYLATWDTVANTWSAVGSGAGTNGSLNSWVNALTVSGTALYVGGNFTDVANGGTQLWAADYIAKWDGASWSALGSNGAGNGALNNDVFALGVSGADLYVGGGFTNVNNSGTPLPAADYIARWDGTSWSALGSGAGGSGALNLTVFALAFIGTDLYAGGGFSTVYNGSAQVPGAAYVARWDGSAWSALGSNGAGNGALNSWVHALAVSGTDLYVGGNFIDISNGGLDITAADTVARWNGTNWSPLGSDGAGDGSLSGQVHAMVAAGADLYVGGEFLDVNSNGQVIPAADRVAVYGLVADPTAPAVGITRAGPSPTTAASVGFTVTFSEAVTGVDAGDFSLAAAGPSGATISGVSGSGSSYLVTVSTGAGDGTLRLAVRANATIFDAGGHVPAGLPFTTGEPYTIDRTPPTLVSILRAGASPSHAATVSFTVRFSEEVTGVDAADFAPASSDLAGAAVSGVSGAGSSYTVTVATGGGKGTLGLDLRDDDSIVDGAGNPLGGAGAANGGFTGGERYTIEDLIKVYLPLAVRSGA